MAEDQEHPEPSIIEETSPLERFRAAALERSVWLGWLIVAIMTAQGISEGVYREPRFLYAIGFFVVVLAGATAANWQEVLVTTQGKWFSMAWTALIVIILGVIASVPGLFEAALPLYSGIAVLSGLILSPIRHGVITGISLTMIISAASGAEKWSSAVIPVLTIAVVAAATALISIEFEREGRRSNARLQELLNQRADFERLYAVSATLAGAESLDEGLPQIVGTICRYLEAQVGLVFLYHPQDHTLRVMSPMWVNGHQLSVEQVKMRVSEGGVVAQVFRSGRPVLLNQISANPDQYGVIGELGIAEAMIAPLRVEGYNVGAIAVGDPSKHPFTDEQLQDLASLAAPAALVLSQLGRYEAAAEMTRRMQEIAQMKTDFVSVVSHELRTPLTSIMGSLDTLSRPELPKEIAEDLMDSARRQAGRLQRLIEDLLMISRIDRQSVPVNPEPIRVKTFLTEIARTVSKIEKLRLSVEPADLVILADPDHLGRVFINLMDNASKYAPGSPVELVARAVRSRVNIDVVDHGEGIPIDQVSRVFDAFTQLERSDTRTKGGTGLGLSIVKGLVEAMGGQVSVSETPGGGATFTVSLPPATVQVGVDV